MSGETPGVLSHKREEREEISFKREESDTRDKRKEAEEREERDTREKREEAEEWSQSGPRVAPESLGS